MDDAQQIIYDAFSILLQWAMKYNSKPTLNNILRVGKLLGYSNVLIHLFNFLISR